MCGQPDYSVNDLKMSVEYKGINANDASVKMFWEVLSEMNPRDRAQFLLFARGASRLSKDDHLSLSRLSKSGVSADTLLPTARTCFFEVHLPAYTTKPVLKSKLFTSIYGCVTMELVS